MDGIYLFIALFFLAVLIIAVIGLIYVFRHMSKGNGASCSSNYQCQANQVCANNVCQSALCSKNSDCQTNQECVYGACVTQNCNGANTCLGGSDQVCIPSQNGDYCAFLPSTCSSDHDCYAGTLSCNNGKCVQCIENRDCSLGQTCNGQGVCVSDCTNAPCASGSVCVNEACCPGTGITSCTATSDCSSSTPYCIDSVCTCLPGVPLDKCTSDADCSSGSQCVSDNQGSRVCSYSGGTSCLYNNTGSSGSTSFPYCPQDTPFCVNGVCSISSLGSVCTTEDSGNCGGYCVNGVCSVTAGWFGDQCIATSDCSYVSGTSTEQQSFQCVGQVCL